MAQQHSRAPFSSHSSTQSQTVFSGPMSYNPGMHGSTLGFPSSTPFPALTDPSTLPPDPTYYDISVATHKQIASIQAKLDQKLGPEYISQRPGPGGGPKLTYAEGWKIINLANEVFGFNGWSSSICSLNVDYIDGHDEGRRWNCGVSAVVRVTLRDGVYHEDVGYGAAENVKNKGGALDKCKKEAVTDAIKRTLRSFGNLLGNCLYDKQYTQEIVKIKVQQPKFDRRSLHRRPEFEEKASGSGTGSTEARDVSTAASIGKHSDMPPPPPPQQMGKVNPAAQIKPEPVVRSAYVPAQPRSNTHHTPHVPPLAQRATPTSESRSADSSTSTSASTCDQVPPPIHEPSVDPDEASYFNSEDDALFMQVDMEGVGSMVLEEDRPIEYEDEAGDGHSGTSVNQGEPRLPEELSMEHQNTISSSSARPTHPTNVNSVNGQTAYQNRHHHQPPPPQAQQHKGQQKAQQRPPRPHAQANPRMPQQHTPQQNPPQNQPSHNHQHRLSRQHSKPIQSPATASSPAMSLMGGFHAPPVVGPSSHHPNRSSGPSTSAVPKSAQVAGMKRGVDAISSAMSYGDQQHTPRNVSGMGKPRAVLVPLEVGEGGDVKRVKR